MCNRQFLFICTDRSRYMYQFCVRTHHTTVEVCAYRVCRSAKAVCRLPCQIRHWLVTIILQWSVGSMACRTPILRFEQCCSTEATIGFVLRIVATFARFFSFLILTPSSRTCSSTQKLSRISVFSLLYCFQLIHRQFLHLSNIQCCPALNRRSRFRSVIPNLCHRISYGKLGTNTNSPS